MQFPPWHSILFLLIFVFLFFPPTRQLQIPCGKSFFPCPENGAALLVNDGAKELSDSTNNGGRKAHGVAIHSPPSVEIYPAKINDQMLRTAARQAHEETEVLYNESGTKPLDLS